MDGGEYGVMGVCDDDDDDDAMGFGVYGFTRGRGSVVLALAIISAHRDPPMDPSSSFVTFESPSESSLLLLLLLLLLLPPLESEARKSSLSQPDPTIPTLIEAEVCDLVNAVTVKASLVAVRNPSASAALKAKPNLIVDR